jgi:hypothetical protein
LVSNPAGQVDTQSQFHEHPFDAIRFCPESRRA